MSCLTRLIAVCSFAVIVVATCAAGLRAQEPKNSREGPDVAIENAGVAVEVDGRPVLIVYARIAGFTPQERAEGIGQRIVSVGKNQGIPVESIHAEDRGTWTEIFAGEHRIMGITEADAIAAERQRSELATEYTEIIRQVVSQYRVDHTLKHLIWGAIYAVAATAACLL